MIAINRTGMNMHIMCYRYLPQQFPATQANVPAQNFISVLRRPNQMVFAVPNRMTATLVKLHKWMLRIPSPKGEGFTDPLTGTVNAPPAKAGGFGLRLEAGLVRPSAD